MGKHIPGILIPVQEKRRQFVSWKIYDMISACKETWIVKLLDQSPSVEVRTARVTLIIADSKGPLESVENLIGSPGLTGVVLIFCRNVILVVLDVENFFILEAVGCHPEEIAH